jgi:hypothetical protein
MLFMRIIGVIALAAAVIAMGAPAGQAQKSLSVEETRERLKYSARAPEAPQNVVRAYDIVPQAASGNVWMVNTLTGEVRVCMPPDKPEMPPACGPWTKPVQ